MGGFLSGIAAGIMTGLGLGGGIVLIILLNYFTQFSQKELQAINLIYYMPTALFALYFYGKEKKVDYKIGLKMIAFGIFAAIFGAVLANKIDTNILKKLFGVYLVIIGIYIMLKNSKE